MHFGASRPYGLRVSCSLLAIPEIPTNSENIFQCLEGGTRLPDWMSAAYGSLTRRVERTFDFGTRVSAGCTSNAG